MTDESQQEDEEQLTEKEKQRWKQLEENEAPATGEMEEGQSKPEDSDPSSNASEPRDQQLDAVIHDVKLEFREWKLVKRRDLITKLGNAFENVVSDPKDVCEEIKNTLGDEIAEGLISARDIERYCPDKWKKNTKPKAENDKLSFSKQQQIAVTKTQDGESVTETEKEVGNGLDTLPPQPKCGANDRINVDIPKFGSTAFEFYVPFEPLRQHMTARLQFE